MTPLLRVSAWNASAAGVRSTPEEGEKLVPGGAQHLLALLGK